MDILEFAFWSGCVGFILAGALLELARIAWKEYRIWKKGG